MMELEVLLLLLLLLLAVISLLCLQKYEKKRQKRLVGIFFILYISISYGLGLYSFKKKIILSVATDIMDILTDIKSPLLTW